MAAMANAVASTAGTAAAASEALPEAATPTAPTSVPSMFSAGAFDESDDEGDIEGDVVLVLERWEQEQAEYLKLDKKEKNFAKHHGTKVFNPMVFWADAEICRRFPIHAELARSEFAGPCTEANCERTFSYVARVLSDLRRGRMSPDQLRCHVVGHAGSKHFPPTTAELWAKYITKSQASEAAMST